MIRRYAFVGLTGLLALTGCKEQKQEKPSPDYKTMTVQLSDDTLQTEYSATMTGEELVEVRPQVSGLITRILIKEGQKVRKGQALFVIDQVPYQAAVNTAAAGLKAAEAAEAAAKLSYDSRRKLNEQKVVSDFDLQTSYQELLQARAKVEEARAQLKNARNSLGYTTVKSPADGTTGMIPYHVGALVSSSISDPLVTVSDDSRMRVYFSLSERECTDLMMQYGSMDAFLAQMPDVRLRLSNGAEYPQAGRVDAVSGIVDGSTGSVRLRAVFPNPDHLLKNGGSGTLLLTSLKKGVIVIPQTATYELQDHIMVYKKVDGKAQSQRIEVNRLNNGTSYLVEDGLKAGDVIVAEGAGLVKEGDALK